MFHRYVINFQVMLLSVNVTYFTPFVIEMLKVVVVVDIVCRAVG